ncbi:IS110 family transposase [Labilibaculum manganireducens]|uniref:Uncharacterized protein n=1 Tax=Labilibaculum manganireducens TaxID=1940525 RepID=A0A2N3HQ22_9BACT|nr:IS110 family transposase [Labilibaculum manganireducens]PKQ60150.1 hypothetical protein BZG01_21260 [Labilibaculum manganireducens]
MNESQELSKQVVGIDIGKDMFYACYKALSNSHKIVIKGTKSFTNDLSGMQEFYTWCINRNTKPGCSLVFVMEATGVYYENLAYFLYERDCLVSVQLAQKIKYYAKSCNLKTKTDKVDSKMIAEFGIEKNLSGTDIWTPPSKSFKMIRDLSREHTSLKEACSTAQSQLHALQQAYSVHPRVITLKQQQIEFYKQQEEAVKQEMLLLVKEDEILFDKLENIISVKGLGFITVIKILAETNGFLLFRNIRQLVSYAGLDVIEKESGSFKGKTKISKKGNARIRAALYMPAMTASVYNPDLKTFYNRINEGRSVKKQGLIAVMRKLLILIYTLWKKNEAYIINYNDRNLSTVKA